MAGARPRSTVFAVVVLLAGSSPWPSQGQVCYMRSCLPDDTTQIPKICYTHTVAEKFPRQSFATCPSETPHCDFCHKDPPCESRCSLERLSALPPGAPCFFDEECGGPFAKCMQRVCRRALHTHQKCSPDDPNDVCIFGQKSCFRGVCQGLKTGDPCVPSKVGGQDIDCSPGWYCFLGVCTPQLPRSHGCTGQHARECVRGSRCNLALSRPVCVRRYTLDLGEPSSDEALCKSSHYNPNLLVCAHVPELVYRFGGPLVAGADCTSNKDCPRKDGSLGECACKRWWEGEGTAGYCELWVQDSGRPAFKRFWETAARFCHPSWSDERCSVETGMEDVWQQVSAEREVLKMDPTEVKSCGAAMFPEFTSENHAASGRRGCTDALTFALAVAAVLI